MCHKSNNSKCVCFACVRISVEISKVRVTIIAGFKMFVKRFDFQASIVSKAILSAFINLYEFYD